MENLYLSKIKKEDISNLMGKIKKDFILQERMPKNILNRAFSKGVMKGFYLTDDDIEYGYIVYDYMETSPYVFIMYLAIDEKYRNQGYGSKMMTLFKGKIREKKIILLADDPLDLKNYSETCSKKNKLNKKSGELQIREDRIKFYSKNGLESIPDVAVTILGIKALVLTDQKKKIEKIDSLIYKIFWRTLGFGCLLMFVNVTIKNK